jgi:hypothetical protein
VNKPTLTSKSVFVPRGTATYTPKWSIVVLAIACFGVLKLNGLHGKTENSRERPSTASFLPIVETKTVPNRLPPERVSKLRRMNLSTETAPGNGQSNQVGSRGEGSNHIDSAAMAHVKNGK